MMMTGSEPCGRTPHEPAILAIISHVMIVLDISVVLTGLPKIRQQLRLSEANPARMQSACTLSFGGFLLLGARASDILRRRSMLVVGLAIFTLVSMAIGASTSPAWLLSWRTVPGIGSAVPAPSILAVSQTNFPEGDERTALSPGTMLAIAFAIVLPARAARRRMVHERDVTTANAVGALCGPA